jgi:hypothetical protein
MREALVDVATGYTCEIVSYMEDYSKEQRIIVEVNWPNEEKNTET